MELQLVMSKKACFNAMLFVGQFYLWKLQDIFKNLQTLHLAKRFAWKNITIDIPNYSSTGYYFCFKDFTVRGYNNYGYYSFQMQNIAKNCENVRWKIRFSVNFHFVCLQTKISLFARDFQHMLFSLYFHIKLR